jgi:preprotein translocase SecE subunit
MPGQVLTAIVAAGLLFGAFKLLTSPRGEGWMVALEEQGWFHAKAYKRVLGIRVRRLTMLGMLLLGGTGVYSIYTQGGLGNDWTIDIPFTQKDGAPEGTMKSFTVLTDAKVAIPLILLVLTLWIAYRAVNVPTFAEFLIATEAEMNKVSWTSRKRLGQDTIVVLVTTIMMALFLLFVDRFWGWLLSTSIVGVLPAKATHKDKTADVAKW